MRERWAAKPRDARNEGGSPRRKKRLPAQPELMKYALASQRKNTIGWCAKRWQQTVNNRNHWQIDDGWSTAGMFFTFSENWHSIIKQNNLSTVVTLLFCNFADWFWKKPDFSIVLCGKARFEPKYVHLSGCCAKQHRGRSDQCKMWLTGLPDSYGSWHLYICHFRFGLSTFYVASLLFMKGTSCCVIRRS